MSTKKAKEVTDTITIGRDSAFRRGRKDRSVFQRKEGGTMGLRKLCLLVAACVFALTAPVSAASFEGSPRKETGGVYRPQQLLLSMDAESTVSDTLTQKVYFSNFSSGSYNYYDQLNAMEKTVYDGLKGMKPSGGTVYVQFQYTDGVPDASSIQTILSGALDALLFDYTELFWLDLGSSHIKAYADDGSDPVVTLEFEPAVASGFPTSGSGLTASLQSAVNSIAVSGSSRYEKLKSIHDALAGRVTYDYDAVSYYEKNQTVTGSIMQSFTAYGALVNGKAVCQGYAEAFKLLCDKQGIPCIVVVGTGVVSASESGSHMWNAVKMEDGSWYNVDVTWDDQSVVLHDFFLVGSESTAPAFSSLTFAQSHRADGEFTLYHYDNKEFSYPAISKTAYVPGNGSTATEPSHVDVTLPQPAPSVTTPTITKPSIAHTDPPPAATATGVLRPTAPSNQTSATLQASQTTTETLCETDGSTDITGEDSGDQFLEDATGFEPETTSASISALAASGDSHTRLILIIGGAVIVAAAAGIVVLLLIKRQRSRSTGM